MSYACGLAWRWQYVREPLLVLEPAPAELFDEIGFLQCPDGGVRFLNASLRQHVHSHLRPGDTCRVVLANAVNQEYQEYFARTDVRTQSVQFCEGVSSLG